VDSADDGRPLGLRDVLAILGHLVRALMALALIGAVVAWVPGPARAGALAQVSGGLPTPLAPGTMTVDRDKVAASGGGISLTFTYTAANDSYGLKAGTVMLTVPDGWTAPSSEPGAPGYVQTTAPCGSGYCVPTVDNMTIAVSGVTLARDQSFDITYTDVAAPDSVATFDFTAQVTPASRRPAVDLGRIQVTTCANGVGELTVNPQSITAATTRDFEFTYTAGECGLVEGSAVKVDVPAGWTPPSLDPNQPGYTYARPGTVTLTGMQITITGAVLDPGETFTLWYVNAFSPSPGSAVFHASEQFGNNTNPEDLTQSPQITVLRSSGGPKSAESGTMTVSPGTVTASGRTKVTFTYTAPPGGLPSGTVALTVPRRWTAPTRKPDAPGYTTSSVGTVSIAGRRITVTGAALAAGGTLTITYHDATAPRSPGQTEFRAFEGVSATARLSALAQSPVITVAGPAAGPPWLTVLLGVALAAVCATAVALSVRFSRRRTRRPAPATEVAAVPHPDPPRVAAVRKTGNEPSLALRIEPYAGTTVRTLRSQS
jgi:hypothetical protein